MFHFITAISRAYDIFIRKYSLIRCIYETYHEHDSRINILLKKLVSENMRREVCHNFTFANVSYSYLSLTYIQSYRYSSFTHETVWITSMFRLCNIVSKLFVHSDCWSDSLRHCSFFEWSIATRYGYLETHTLNKLVIDWCSFAY